MIGALFMVATTPRIMNMGYRSTRYPILAMLGPKLRRGGRDGQILFNKNEQNDLTLNFLSFSLNISCQQISRGNTYPEAILILNKITLKPILELYFMKMNYCGAFLKIKVLFRML